MLCRCFRSAKSGLRKTKQKFMPLFPDDCVVIYVRTCSCSPLRSRSLESMFPRNSWPNRVACLKWLVRCRVAEFRRYERCCFLLIRFTFLDRIRFVSELSQEICLARGSIIDTCPARNDSFVGAQRNFDVMGDVSLPCRNIKSAWVGSRAR